MQVELHAARPPLSVTAAVAASTPPAGAFLLGDPTGGCKVAAVTAEAGTELCNLAQGGCQSAIGNAPAGVAGLGASRGFACQAAPLAAPADSEVVPAGGCGKVGLLERDCVWFWGAGGSCHLRTISATPADGCRYKSGQGKIECG